MVDLQSDKDKILQKTEKFVRENINKYDSGHDWWHIERVRKLAEYINLNERLADPFILDIVVLLHDYADSKFTAKGDNSITRMRQFLIDSGLDKETDRIIGVITNSSFSKKSPEGKSDDPLLHILKDADRLDAIGAIGIARAFNYGGFRNNPIYNPDKPLADKSTIQHFYDKLLRLKNGMHTETAKKLAEKRHEYLEMFLDRFYEEWDMKS